jgi:phosphoribosylanthranilate isomerase
LAGGLNVDNLAAAVAQSGASAIDVSSGVETAPGRKDPAKIAAFLDLARDL